MNKVTNHSIGVITEPREIAEAMDKLVDNHIEYVTAMKSYAAENTLQKAYEPLIRALKR